ncbi:MAG: short-chain dehydrogenase/reductase [Flavobacteriaceae bacterium]|nr:short-chain dehydrogenase/reductase [Flavobacteriaceae bacterium]|tara:strand:+ start:130911 stop:131714 length:804 start_codon:yes stop_codon:yes gene_type:complete
MSQVVLITGASSGLGKAIAAYLSTRDFVVYGTSRKPKAEQVDGYRMIALDVLNKDSISKAVNLVVEKEGRLDILINNAGMGITGPIEDTPTDEMRRVFETNFFGAVDVIKAVLPQMRSQKAGLVINVTSIAGYMGLPYRGVYSATKSAFAMVTESLGMEVKEFGIDVVSVAPGDFATNIAAGRFHTPVFEDSAYKEKYQLNLDLMDAHVDSGMNPDVLAQKVFSIIRSKNRKVHYKVGGFMEKFSIVLKRVLPDRVYEKLLMNHYKL